METEVRKRLIQRSLNSQNPRKHDAEGETDDGRAFSRVLYQVDLVFLAATGGSLQKPGFLFKYARYRLMEGLGLVFENRGLSG